MNIDIEFVGDRVYQVRYQGAGFKVVRPLDLWSTARIVSRAVHGVEYETLNNFLGSPATKEQTRRVLLTEESRDILETKYKFFFHREAPPGGETEDEEVTRRLAMAKEVAGWLATHARRGNNTIGKKI